MSSLGRRLLGTGPDLVYSRFLVFEICLEWRSCGWEGSEQMTVSLL